MSVLCRSVPVQENYVRLDNIKGGNTPDFAFFGLIKSSTLNGSLESSSTTFKNNGLREVNLTLNGNSCNGFPLRIQNDNPIWAYNKFFTTIGRLMDQNAAAQMRMSTFKNLVIYSHKFEGDDASQGWLGLTLAFSETLQQQHTLAIWTVQNVRVTIDKYNQVEKFDL